MACTVCTKDFIFVLILLPLLAIETRPGLLKPKALDKMAVIIESTTTLHPRYNKITDDTWMTAI